MKDLSKLSPGELGKLFPIMLETYNPEWPAVFQKEKEYILKLLAPDLCGEIAHFGSTAVPGIIAKPTIDILVEIPSDEESRKQIIEKMQQAGYHHIPRNDSPPPYPMFVKGYTPHGFEGQVFHLHCAPKSHSGLWNRLYFRDFLIRNPNTAREYETLKIRLAKEFQFDRDGYTVAKTVFVERITQLAVSEKQV
ncbi:MAG: GrpB family protein [Prolixibacteraceae bacterium]